MFAVLERKKRVWDLLRWFLPWREETKRMVQITLRMICEERREERMSNGMMERERRETIFDREETQIMNDSNRREREKRFVDG